MVVTKEPTKTVAIKTSVEKEVRLAQATLYEGPMGSNMGNFYSPYGGGSQGGSFSSFLQNQGITPEKLIIPREYHQVISMCYDFYQRNGVVGTTMDRLSEFAITEIQNGERKTTNEANEFFFAVLHSKPSRLMRFLHTAALEYFLSGMVLPRVMWVDTLGKDISPELKPTKKYSMPIFDIYPPMLVDVEWADWSKKNFYLKIPTSDVKAIKNAQKTKEQQLRYDYLVQNYPDWISLVGNGTNRVPLTDIDPILRKETSSNPYPTPYLFKILEPLVFKQQLRRMDFSVASRVINAILLVQEGNDNFPLVKEDQENLTAIRNQITSRSNDPRLMERLVMLFSNHTTKITWITPDVTAMLDKSKYDEVNFEISDGLGFPRILLTGQSSGAGTGAEVSTWAIQSALEELRSALLEWITDIYETGAMLNGFRNLPDPAFKPLRLQDFIKTAAIFAQAFKEGNISRTSRDDAMGFSFETETELMQDEIKLMAGLPQFPATPFSPPPPVNGPDGTPPTPTIPTVPINPAQNPSGRPRGSQNVPLNERNVGIKPSGQQPTSQLKAENLWSDEELVEKIMALAESRGIKITAEVVAQTPPLMNE